MNSRSEKKVGLHGLQHSMKEKEKNIIKADHDKISIPLQSHGQNKTFRNYSPFSNFTAPSHYCGGLAKYHCSSSYGELSWDHAN